MNPVQPPSKDEARAVPSWHVPEWALLGVIALGGVGSLGLTVLTAAALIKLVSLVAHTFA